MSHRADGLNDIFENDVTIKKRVISEAGQVTQTPTQAKDIVNKEYVDNNRYTDAEAVAAVESAGYFKDQTDVDHNQITNTHNLTTDIDHNSITNTHNLTTDIDHDQLTNFVSNEHIDWTQASAGTIDASNYVDNDTTDHTLLSNIGSNTHAQIDTHIASSAIHFTEASIDHSAIANIGTNSHSDIDTHIASSAIHFTEASIDHTAISNIGTNTHAQIDSHISDTSDPHGATLTQTNLNVASCAITADNTTVSMAFVRNIVLGTSATPPTASNFVQGTIYLQYTP